ncbi:flagellar biosynthesis regulator FlaF [Rhodovarius sp.]|uniref:flagellar biosynthesis regulator FlaF n=1 Tax=Rhodovarius sp. TaxID=2972673 RepID=UPI003340F772
MSETLGPAITGTTSAPPPQGRSQGAAAYRRRLSAKHMEAEVFTRATRSIREAEATPSSLNQARAVADNRRLWDAVLVCVLDPGNALPKGLRAQLASLARTVLRECDGETPDLAFVAEMNEQIAAGLWA